MTNMITILWIIVCAPLAFFPLLGIDQDIIFNYSLLAQIITPVAAAVFCYMTSRVFPEDDAMRKVWNLLGTGVLCWGIGAMLFALYPIIHAGQETPYPWYSDIGYLLMTPFVLTALFIFKKNLHIDSPLWGRISAGCFFLAGLALSIAFNLSKFTDFDALIPFIVTLIYTIGDPLLLGGTVLVASLLAGGEVARPWWLVLIGLILYYAANVVYTYLTVNEQYATGDFIDIGWLAGFGCIAIAALMTRSLFKDF